MSRSSIRRNLALTFMATVMAASALVATARPAMADDSTRLFISVLDEQGITYTSEGDAIRAGHAVCTYFDLGYDSLDVISDVVDASGLDWYDAGYFVGASIAGFCPEYLDEATGGAFV